MTDNIGNIGPILPQNVGEVNNKSKPHAGENNKNEGGVIKDTVEISNEARAVNRALGDLNESAAVRKDLVEKAIEERVLENKRIPSYQMAAKLLLEDSIE